MPLAKALSHSLEKSGSVEISGELRRKNALIYSIDIALSHKRAPLLHPLILKILSRQKEKIKVLLKKGIPATFNFSTASSFPFVLLCSTGSSMHVKELKKEALKKKIPFRSLKNLNSEETIYNRLKLPYIPPELREDGSEIRFAKRHKLPQLIEPDDIKGAFHCHTVASDGMDTIKSMMTAAKKLGWSYIGISDHSQSLKIARGMDERRLLAQIEEIQKINRATKTGSFYIFAGVECDILKDGQLDFREELLKKLDFVIASVHSFFHLNKKEMTQRLIKAIENPYTTMIGHVTGRLLRYRDPYELDLLKVIDACAANGKIIELNAYPNRMDMDWSYWHRAKNKGVKCCINPDAHSAKQLAFCDYGVAVARKGWLEKKDVLNTLSLKEIKRFLK